MRVGCDRPLCAWAPSLTMMRSPCVARADSANAIRQAFFNGTIFTVVGNGTAGFSGDGGPGTAAMVNKPVSVMSDGALPQRGRSINSASKCAWLVLVSSGAGAGGVIFADGQQCIRRWFANNASVATVAGRCTAGGYQGDGGMFAEADATKLRPRLLCTLSYHARVQALRRPASCRLHGPSRQIHVGDSTSLTRSTTRCDGSRPTALSLPSLDGGFRSRCSASACHGKPHALFFALLSQILHGRVLWRWWASNSCDFQLDDVCCPR